MDEQQVDVVRLQFAERFVYTDGSLFISGIGNPYFLVVMNISERGMPELEMAAPTPSSL